MNIKVIIPARNEQDSIGKVITEIPDLVSEVIVVDNASGDKTAEVAKAAGATVLTEMRKGYGSACLKGIQYLKGLTETIDIVVFMDADYSDYPEETALVVDPIIAYSYDLVIGSRVLGQREKGSMTYPQVFGNRLATSLLRWLYGVQFTDLGPFRAIKFDKLKQIEMRDTNFGWTVEMQLKAAKKGLRCTEVPVRYRMRIGVSKVSGTVKGTFMAGYKILYTIFRYL